MAEPGLEKKLPGKDFTPNRRDADPYPYRDRKELPMCGGTQSVMNFGTASEQAPWYRGGRPVSASPTRTTSATSATKPEPEASTNLVPGIDVR